MRSLVEQTADEARGVLERTGFAEKVDVHLLMGGLDEANWYAQPEKPAILVGTQDMLLSRSLNRGYAMGRAAWPRAFGLINSDALWVMDEVQLMGVGLTSSAQIQSFWEVQKSDLTGVSKAPRATWWMSATLQPNWLATPETRELLPVLRKGLLTVDRKDRQGVLWDSQKPLKIEQGSIDGWAELVVNAHIEHEADPATGRHTLAVVNTVRRATELFSAIERKLKGRDIPPELRLIHSRFRPHERTAWSSQFLSRDSLNPNVNRILVATQVVEAGVDISASCLLTELAPWPSLVQRFGRAARYGGKAQIHILDSNPDDEKKALPYELQELNVARDTLSQLQSVSILELEEFESRLAETDPISLNKLYPFEPLHVLMRHEFDELFDTSPDLSGADIDVSRFIRKSGDERDVQVFWRKWEGAIPPRDWQPLRDELCTVSIVDARSWVKKAERNQIWYWDYLDGIWKQARSEHLRPGIVLMSSEEFGGYDPMLGFTGDKRRRDQMPLDVFAEVAFRSNPQSDWQEVSESCNEAEWKTVFTHCHEAASIGRAISTELDLSEGIENLLTLAMRLHDWGKAHPSFADGTYRVQPKRSDLAKAPKAAWRSLHEFYHTDSHGPRLGFRHELASCLAILEFLRQSNSNHDAFKAGGYAWTEKPSMLEGNVRTVPEEPLEKAAIANELDSLNANEFNLLLFLVASHHGKVRLSLQASPKDQDFPFTDGKLVGIGMPIHGVRDQDVLPAITLPDANGNQCEMPSLLLSLDPASLGLSERFGPSWSERMLDLVALYGPFFLGYLEAIVRATDARASALPAPDPLLANISLQIPEGIKFNQIDEAETQSGDETTMLENDELEETDVEN